ncbi:ATP-binding cassette domain-containing protein [uncultured Mobiluncus sp.]|uniref:ABC transporter ATP-binding protein n=1 Tax=uncultured Mobiluncus sp. TaxID=293425 RepID=UPI0027D996F3|nr:ATP-binding cassette domain-containing protein [uncultured Mobiluncus sp.]
MGQNSRALRIEGLYKSFGTREVLRGVSMNVEPGQVMGFVGANGSGKTTTMRIVMGIIDANRGRVTFGGEPIDAPVRASIGYMPEERGLYPKMKVGEQLEYFARLHGQNRSTARESTQRWVQRLGVSERLKDSVEKLSLGNQQRVQLAAALVHNPVMLILDEPFSGLDPLAVDVMSGVLQEYAAQGVPVIFSSHQLSLVESLCTHVSILSGGSIVASGEVEKLRREAGTPVVRLCGDEAAVVAGTEAARKLNQSVQFFPGGLLVPVLSDSPTAHAILQAAVETGNVTEFVPVIPTLAEIFRSAVEENEPKTGATAMVCTETADVKGGQQ